MAGMHPEDQNHEWKATWHDEYFKWLCGYANAGGGRLFVGVNDDGYVVGLRDYRALLEKLPNQIRTKLGIIASVNYHRAERRGTNIRYGADGTRETEALIPEDIRCRDRNRYAAGVYAPLDEEQQRKLAKWESDEPVHVNDDGTLDYLEIVVTPYPHMVSCDGKVYKRSGSTLQELDGIELEKFVLERSGRTWDDIMMTASDSDELSAEALRIFRRKASAAGRLSAAELAASDDELLRSLRCEDLEGHLSRAGILFFHPDPEEYITGAFIRIGSSSRKGRRDTVHGPYATQIDEALDLLYSEYINENAWPRAAARELLVNAAVGKDYTSGNPIQITVYKDRLTIFNEGTWPADKLPAEDVYRDHASYAANPRLADLFTVSGDAEALGRGYAVIRDVCARTGAPLPEIETGSKSAPARGVTVTCRFM